MAMWEREGCAFSVTFSGLGDIVRSEQNLGQRKRNDRALRSIPDKTAFTLIVQSGFQKSKHQGS